ncbi:hypothetical protein FDB25_12490 [Clostridium botulinum]|nr:hypothetical protein [Clostridium botulinum]
MNYYEDNGIFQELIKIFENSNKTFILKNIHLLEYEISERSLCGALMKSLSDELRETKFKSYHVDIEYNRNNGGMLKTILDPTKLLEFKIINITCDLIIHSRGENVTNDNLIALEMKKSNRPKKDKISDKERLICLTKSSYDNDVWSYDGATFPEHVCRYILGIYYEIDFDKRVICIEYYRNGRKVEEKFLKF